MNLVIVEDHVIVRETLRALCEQGAGWRVVGETDSGVTAIKLIFKLRPDVVLLDLGLADLDGFTVAERAREALPATKILVFSGRLDDYTVHRLGQIGVHGFLDKPNVDLVCVREALLALAAGQTYFSPAFRAFKGQQQADPRALVKLLSDAEQRVLSLIGQGMNNEEIAQELSIMASTAQKHRSSILCKLHIDGTPKLVAFAIQHGFAVLGPGAACELVED